MNEKHKKIFIIVATIVVITLVLTYNMYKLLGILDIFKMFIICIFILSLFNLLCCFIVDLIIKSIQKKKCKGFKR